MFASVLINSNARELNRVFDYMVPREMEKIISIGSRVFVPFGRGKNLTEGYVIDFKDKSDFECKEIAKVEDSILVDASNPGALQNKIGILQLVSSLITLTKSNSGILTNSSLKTSFKNDCMQFIILSGLKTNNNIDLHILSKIF